MSKMTLKFPFSAISFPISGRKQIQLLIQDAHQSRLESFNTSISLKDPGASVHLLPPGDPGRGQTETIWRSAGGWRSQDERLVVRPRPSLDTDILYSDLKALKNSKVLKVISIVRGIKKQDTGFLILTKVGPTNDCTLSLYINITYANQTSRHILFSSLLDCPQCSVPYPLRSL